MMTQSGCKFQICNSYNNHYECVRFYMLKLGWPSLLEILAASLLWATPFACLQILEDLTCERDASKSFWIINCKWWKSNTETSSKLMRERDARKSLQTPWTVTGFRIVTCSSDWTRTWNKWTQLWTKESTKQCVFYPHSSYPHYTRSLQADFTLYRGNDNYT